MQGMPANEPYYVVCNNGVFSLPEELYESLLPLVRNGFVYLRQDDDVLTISPILMTDGRRRMLNTWYRVQMFRGAKTLAIVNLRESLQVMAVDAR